MSFRARFASHLRYIADRLDPSRQPLVTEEVNCIRHPEFIKAALRERGVTQADLAERLNLDESTISQVIHSRRSRRVEKAISEILKVKPEILWPERYPSPRSS